VAERKFEERWENFRDLVEHLFLEPGRGSLEADVIWYPATDVYETQDAFVVRMDLSGVDRSQIHIQIRDRVLEVRGVRGDVIREPHKKTFHKMEIAMGPFARSIQVPSRFAGTGAKATYVDGVLEIRLQARPDTGPHEVKITVD
jgi:HSP20 family protein